MIWPAMLMAAGLPLPETRLRPRLPAHQGREDEQVQGQRDRARRPRGAFGVDAYRYYFLRDVQFGADGSISMESMVQRYNGDLANDWGNLCSRLFNMTGSTVGRRRARPVAPRRHRRRRRLRAHRRGAARALRGSDGAASTTPAPSRPRGTSSSAPTATSRTQAPWNLAKPRRRGRASRPCSTTRSRPSASPRCSALP